LSRLRLLVTGSTGFVGRYLIEQVVRNKQVDTTLLVRHGATLKWPLENPNGSAVKLAPIDLANPYTVRLPFREYDALVNLVGPRSSLESAQWEANIEYIRNLLIFLRRVSVRRIVHFSSVSVYGIPKGSATVTESFCPAPCDWYGATKVLGERMWKAFHEETGIPVAILRPSWVVGYGSHLLDGYLFRAFDSRVSLVMRLGTPLNIVYVRDVADAAIAAVLHHTKGLAVYNINAMQRWTFDQFLEELDYATARLKIPVVIPKALVSIMASRFGSLKFILSEAFFSAQKAKDELGFSPQYDLTAIVKEIFALRGAAKSHRIYGQETQPRKANPDSTGHSE